VQTNEPPPPFYVGGENLFKKMGIAVFLKPKHLLLQHFPC